ncbi:MAG: ribosome silencing factor [Alphaproteobacteria bacterium]
MSSLDDDQGDGPRVIDLAGKSTIADYMVVVTGRSQRHVSTLAKHLVELLKARGLASVPVEGMARCDWVLVDAGDVIVHIFRPEIRTFYNLEKMWEADLPESGASAELTA